MSDPTAPPPASEFLLKAEAVSKSYGMGRRQVDVLRAVDFGVRKREFVAVQGASGSGKSTLLHLLGGLDLPDSGEIWFDGERINQLAPEALGLLRNRRIGFVFQAYHLFPELDALENVSLPARIARRDPEATAALARELLSRVGLGDRLDHKPYELSGGEQQRVAVARAMINQPDLIIADEPTGNLDSRTGQEIFELLLKLRAEQQTTLIVATHDDRIAAQAPRLVRLTDGRVGAEGN